MINSISTVPEVHTILTENTHNIDRYKDYGKQISTVPEVHTILTESTHNIDRYKDYDKQYINCTLGTHNTDREYSQY